jgi:hypothetical protein
MWVQPNTSVARAIARGQWQAPLGSSRGRPPDHGQPAAVLASVKDKAFGGAEEAPSLTATARDGDGNVRSGWKNARRAGRTKEWSNNARQKWRDAPLTKKAPYKPNALCHCYSNHCYPNHCYSNHHHHRALSAAPRLS